MKKARAPLRNSHHTAEPRVTPATNTNVAAALGCDAYALCGVTRPAQHSPKLHLIEPEGEASMEAITPTQVLDAVLDQLR